MSNYILYKKTPCEKCDGGYYDAMVHGEYHDDPHKQSKLPCPRCNATGHTLTEVDLLDVLRELGVTPSKAIRYHDPLGIDSDSLIFSDE